MILLSFDIEEFDMPLEYKGSISFEEQIRISREGTIRILDILRKYNAKATFFSTVIFAQNNTDVVKRLLEEGHELASHTYYHSSFKNEDLKASREALEALFNTEVVGLRMPRMAPVEEEEVQKAGYVYNSSINPTFLPGRYNNLHLPRTYFKKADVWQIPASVSWFRIPLFWLSFHNFPQKIYHFLAKQALKRDQYLNIYFHPWEFSDISNPDFKLPSIATKNTGIKMEKRFEFLLNYLSEQKIPFGTFKDFILKLK